jgi:site-specific recombinase XerD
MVRTAVMPTIVDLAPSFARSLRASNKSPKTLVTYLEAVDGLAAFLTAQGMPAELVHVKREHVEAFIEYLLAQFRPATALNRYKSLRVFWNWAVDEGEIERSPMEKMHPPKLGEDAMRVLTVDEIRALLKTCDGPDFENRRDAALVMVFTDTGGRLSEITNLRAEDVDLDEGILRVIGKGNRARELPIGAKTVRALDRYDRIRRQHPYADLPWYWLGRKGRMGTTGVQQMFKRRADDAGIGRINPHLFRHSFAHAYLSSGGSETNLMALTGWTDRTMLQRYAKSTQAERAKAEHRRLSPGDRL